jgi:hypothetical protein
MRTEALQGISPLRKESLIAARSVARMIEKICCRDYWGKARGKRGFSRAKCSSVHTRRQCEEGGNPFDLQPRAPYRPLTFQTGTPAANDATRDAHALSTPAAFVARHDAPLMGRTRHITDAHRNGG